jgi:hypothetical protein
MAQSATVERITFILVAQWSSRPLKSAGFYTGLPDLSRYNIPKWENFIANDHKIFKKHKMHQIFQMAKE